MSAESRHAYRLAWGLIGLLALLIAALGYAAAHANVVTFTLQPKPPAPVPAARPTSFHDTARQPESDRPSLPERTAPRFARVVESPARGSVRALLNHNQPAGSLPGEGTRLVVFPGASNTAAIARPTLPAG